MMRLLKATGLIAHMPSNASSDSHAVNPLIMAGVIAAMTVAGLLMVIGLDYGAETYAPTSTAKQPKVPAEKAMQGSQPEPGTKSGVPLERIPGASPPASGERPPVPLEYAPPPAKTQPKPVEPEPPAAVIQKRVFRGASDDAQSADTLLQFDGDRDGKVDRREAAASDFMLRHFSAIDTNGDGKITIEEMRVFDAERMTSQPGAGR
jgi:hypothetical protein